MAVRAIRGATQVDADDREQVLEATRELVSAVLERNELAHDDVISILFTATPDLVSEFPALAARELGLGDVPLMCATEIDVPHALPRVLRLMAHVETRAAPGRHPARLPPRRRRPATGHRPVSERARRRVRSGSAGRSPSTARPAPGSPASPATSRPGWARPTWTPARCTGRPPSPCSTPASASTTRWPSPARSPRRASRWAPTPGAEVVHGRRRRRGRAHPRRRGDPRGLAGLRRPRRPPAPGRPAARAGRRGRRRGGRGPRHRHGRPARRDAEDLPDRRAGGPGAAAGRPARASPTPTRSPPWRRTCAAATSTTAAGPTARCARPRTPSSSTAPTWTARPSSTGSSTLAASAVGAGERA